MTPVSFNNMINPAESFQVSFLFMILNNDPEAQANILSDIMGFISTADPESDYLNFLIIRKETIYIIFYKTTLNNKKYQEEIIMIKILAACGAGVNSSHQIKDSIETEMSNRGYSVQADAVVVKDINEEMMGRYDVFTPISTPDLGFTIRIPVVEAGPSLIEFQQWLCRSLMN